MAMTGPQIAALQHLVRDMQAAGEHLRIVEPCVFVAPADFAEAAALVEAMLGEPTRSEEGWRMWRGIISLQIGAAS